MWFVLANYLHLFHLFIFMRIQISAATEIFYVLPENSTNAASCPSQPCATLSQYLLDNGTLPVVSNVEYHFLPGEHYVPANMILQNLYNFSIIGTVNNLSSPVVLVGCSQSYVISIINSHFVNIYNVVFRHCNISTSNEMKHSCLRVFCCFSCEMENITLLHYGVVGYNLIGKSYLNGIKIKIMQSTQLCCQEILLRYTACIWNNYSNLMHNLTVNQIVIHNYTKYISNTDDDENTGLYIDLEDTMYHMNISVTNSEFYNMNRKALHIKNRCFATKRFVVVSNCTFQRLSASPSIIIYASRYDNNISFINCTFLKNQFCHPSLIIVKATSSNHLYCKLFTNMTSHLMATNISFIRCQFSKNKCAVLQVSGIKGLVNVFFESLNVSYNMPIKIKGTDIISIRSMNAYFIGSINIFLNHCKANIIQFFSCNITFNGRTIFDANYCARVISLNTYLTIMEYTNITFVNNRYEKTLISVKDDTGYYQPHPFCLFQYVTNKSTAAIKSLLTHYVITIYRNNPVSITGLKLPQTDRLYSSVSFCYFTSHCQWLPSAGFYGYAPEAINKQIIKHDNQECDYHTHICYCSKIGKHNCSIDVLGKVYPGQTLQTNLCNMYSKNDSTVLYAEVRDTNLPATTCKIAHQSQLINFIGNNSNTVNYTIVSRTPDNNRCELFLTASPFLNKVYDTFYVLLLPCPVGFTLQDGICDCDPILPSIIDKCYIDHSAIRRPANTWITAYTQTNSTKFLMSDCPMDYCLLHSSNVNLLYPDSQCQFNRTGILCSQCQQHLSMVFGSSKCMECTNLHILITIIVIVAGIVLVILLYLLNLTVTIGTINGIIFYANIVSINDSVFLVNDNVFKPLRVFISFVNLDLGIETCFYNGMDSYVKKWLQLFFPFYLIIIAVLIITTSRYSSRILRLTYTRSLPVLATLFLLSYTGVLRTVLTVLFSYSTIIHLPSGHQQIVWSIDASVPLFGLKFTILFITCLVLFLLLIPFNMTLLFTRYLFQFRIINHFKPILDAFQGSYKDRYYYWVGVHMTMRSLLFAMYAFQANLKLIMSTMLLIIFSIYSGYIHPHKNKLVNIQELLLLLNLTIMYAVSYQYSKSVFSIVTNIMISLAFIQFCIIALYHFLTYTCHYNIVIALQTLRQKLLNLYHKDHLQNKFDVELLNIPECTYNYTEYQDGLVSDDFK